MNGARRPLASVALAAYTRAATLLEQEGFRWGNDDGNEASHTYAAAQDANVTAAGGAKLLLSIIVNATGSPGAKTFKLQHRKVGAASWTDTPVQ